MTAPITVITATIPGRENTLQATLRSVYTQTVSVENHLVCAHPIGDEQPQMQYTRAKNLLLKAVSSEWVAVLNDDDYWLPHHVETVLPFLAEGDVVYSWEATGAKPRHDYSVMSQVEQVAHWDATNLLDGNALFRRSALEAIGGFPTDWVGGGPWDGGHFADSIARFEDWRMFQQLARLGARFVCVPEETWVYGLGTPGQICG